MLDAPNIYMHAYLFVNVITVTVYFLPPRIKVLMARGLVGPIDLLQILDTSVGGVVEELDFRNEARNAAAFEESLAFLGYATVPPVVGSPTRKLIVTEWVNGRHLEDLDAEEALRFSTMAVEAVTAGICTTGLVHADPHEGRWVGR